MEQPQDITILIILTVMAGISAQVLGNYLKIPSIVFLLLFGILFGQDCLGFLDPSQLGDGMRTIVSLSVALILFEGVRFVLGERAGESPNINLGLV